jgi:hypothetical protein
VILEDVAITGAWTGLADAGCSGDGGEPAGARSSRGPHDLRPQGVHDCLRPKATRCVSQTSWRGDRRALSRVGRGSPRAPASFWTEPISGRHPSFATLQETSNRQPFYRLLPCTPWTSFATIPVHNVGAELVRRRKQGGEYLLRPIWPGRPGSKCSIRSNWSSLKA